MGEGHVVFLTKERGPVFLCLSSSLYICCVYIYIILLHINCCCFYGFA